MELIHKKIVLTTETIKSKLLGVDERAKNARSHLPRPQQQNKKNWLGKNTLQEH